MFPIISNLPHCDVLELKVISIGNYYTGKPKSAGVHGMVELQHLKDLSLQRQRLSMCLKICSVHKQETLKIKCVSSFI